MTMFADQLANLLEHWNSGMPPRSHKYAFDEPKAQARRNRLARKALKGETNAAQ